MLGRQLRICLSALIASALAACGGGGGGGTENQQPPASAVAITAANAAAVSAEAIDTGNTGLAGALAFLTGVQVEAADMPAVPVMDTLASAVRLGLKVRAPRALLGATFTDTVQCPGGGTADISGNEASEDRISVGDTFNATLRNCVLEGVTTSGALSARVVSTNNAETLVVADLTTTNFIATVGAVGGRVNSTLRVTFDETNPAVSRIAMTGAGTTDRLKDGNVRATRTLIDYKLDLATTNATGSTAADVSYKVSGNFPNIGAASFDARTTQSFVTPRGAARPSSGVAKVTGANASNITITVIGTGVRLDIDANGDGTAETTQNLTWAQLEAQL